MATVAKIAAVICLCLIGIVGVYVAFIEFVFSGDAGPGRQTAEKVGAVFIALFTLGISLGGLHLMFRVPRPAARASLDEELWEAVCAGCGDVLPSNLVHAVEGRTGHFCDDCTDRG